MRQFAQAATIGLAAIFTVSSPVIAQEQEEPQPRVMAEIDDPAFIELPAEFEKAVRGCTLDGYIYRMPYNMAVNFDDIAAIPEAGTPVEDMSLFYQMLRPDPDALIGISGAENFMTALKTVGQDIHDTMNTVGGALIDEATSEDIGSPVFNEFLQSTLDTISEQMEHRYDVEVRIVTGEPVQQSGRCPAAPEFAPQPPPPDPGATGPR